MSVLQSYLQGREVARQKKEFDRTNAMRGYIEQNAQGIFSGDSNALSGLAAWDPMAALQIQGTHDQRKRAAAAERRASAAAGRAAELHKLKIEEYAKGLDAAEAAAEAARIEAGVKRVLGANPQTQEELDALLPEQLRGQGITLDNLEGLAAQYMEMADVLKMRAGPERDIRNVGGVAYDFTDPKNVVQLTEPQPSSPLVVIGGQGEQGAAVDSLPVAPSDVPPGSAREAFGLSGAWQNTMNAVTDFFSGKEVYPVTGENARFFRGLEEDLLVTLAQAYPRMPAKDQLERLRRLLPNIGTSEGAQSAYRELDVLRDRFTGDLQRAVARAQRGGGTASQQAELQRQILGLEASLQIIGEAARRLAPPDTGVSDEESELINKWLQ